MWTSRHTILSRSGAKHAAPSAIKHLLMAWQLGELAQRVAPGLSCQHKEQRTLQKVNSTPKGTEAEWGRGG